MMKRKIIATLLLALTLGSITQTHASDIPDEQKQMPRPPVENTGGYSGAYYDDQRTLFRAFTYLESWPQQAFINGSQTTCTSALEEPCKSTNYIFFETPISPCQIGLTRDCIVSLEGRSDSSDWASATLLETASAKIDGPEVNGLNRYSTPFVGDGKRGIPNSGYVSIWKIPSLPHAGGDEYLLIPKLNGDHIGQSGTEAANLDVGVYAVSEDSSQGKSQSDCFLLSTTKCYTRWAHPENSSFRVVLKTAANLVGWFHGRIYDPTIQSTKLSDGQTLVSVEGKAMRVPILSAWAKNSELPKVLDAMIQKEFEDRGNQFAGVAFFGGNSKSRDDQAVIDERNPSFNEAFFARYLEWVKVANDKAYANPSTWSFRTIENSNLYWRCIADGGVSGMVTTNSNAYLAGPPKFEDGVLSYKVSSPHYDSKGSVQIGTYDLAINSKVARCIYGFTSAPIQATISIVYDDGVSKSATTVISEKNGWLRLSAKGFTYSSPILKVSLSQEKTSSSGASKKSITCLKGKLSKVVSGVNPKCPTGYKKKA